MSNISFYKEYYKAITYANKGQELWKAAEDKGSGMGLASGALKYALTLLAGAKKMASDAGTQGACDARAKIVKEIYDDTALQMKQVYYEQESGAEAI